MDSGAPSRPAGAPPAPGGPVPCRGRLKVFLGYAAGVGKSLRMLDEGRRRKQRGEDVVVVAAQEAAPAEWLRGLEVVPLRQGAIDVEAVLKRHPRVAIVDALAQANPPGGRNAERWQDVGALLDAGIAVLTSLNLHYVREWQPRVEPIRGRSTAESVPEAFLLEADEVEVVDAPADYCAARQRSTAGDSAADVTRLSGQLSQLRELALLLAAEVVDAQLERQLRDLGVVQGYGVQERILVCLTSRSNAELMLRRGRRQADRFHGELYAVTVQSVEPPAGERRQLDANLALARQLGAHVEQLQGPDAVATITAWARAHGITQIFAGHSQQRGWLSRWRRNPLERLIEAADGMDVRVFPNRTMTYE